jgi:hypothetical protein
LIESQDELRKAVNRLINRGFFYNAELKNVFKTELLRVLKRHDNTVMPLEWDDALNTDPSVTVSMRYSGTFLLACV